MKVLIVYAVLAAASLGGCGKQPNGDAMQPAGSSVAGRADGASATSLSTNVEDRGGGVRIRLEAAGLPPGKHGLHIHEVGRCDGPKFTSAGAHWNPTSRQHGRDNPAGAHGGDLPNLDIGADGRGRGDFVMDGVRTAEGPRPMYDEDGAALVIHAAADDYRTDPSGQSGDRIACVVLRPAR